MLDAASRVTFSIALLHAARGVVVEVGPTVLSLQEVDPGPVAVAVEIAVEILARPEPALPLPPEPTVVARSVVHGVNPAEAGVVQPRRVGAVEGSEPSGGKPTGCLCAHGLGSREPGGQVGDSRFGGSLS